MPEAGRLKFYDAHNHLQDPRFGGRQAELVSLCAAQGIARMVVNGSSEEDWPLVLALAKAHPQVLPSFGLHPWYVAQRSPDWESHLRTHLEANPAAVGEIGLDRWKPNLDYAGQEEVFLVQLGLAAERDLPASIHCLRAWGRLFELLCRGPRPRRGFLLHSFGGPAAMVPALAKVGAYFSFPGYFLHERKGRQRETFRSVPLERLLVETDAPDQPLPAAGEDLPGAGRPDRAVAPYLLRDPESGQPLNHPANLPAIYEGLARILGLSLEELAAVTEQNFGRLFGSL